MYYLLFHVESFSYRLYSYGASCIYCISRRLRSIFLYLSRIVSSVRKEITDYYFLRTELHISQYSFFCIIFMHLKCLQATYANVWYILRNYMRVKRERERKAPLICYLPKGLKELGGGGGSFYTIRYLEMVVQCVLVNVLYKIRRQYYIS